jgi:hypothetical protein
MGTLASEPAGCLDAGMMCGMSMTWASGPEGTCMEFPTVCIPAGWSTCDPMDSCETGDDDGSEDADDGAGDDDGDADDDGAGDDGSSLDCSSAGLCGGRTLLGEADVDSMFACDMVDGNILATEIAGPIPDMEGMGCLEVVSGNIDFSDMDALPNFDGLSALHTIGGDLKIWGNDALTDITGLHGLNSIAGSVEIRANESLCQSAVDAFLDAVPHIGGAIETEDNADC